ncbi:MAG: pitrilysin family protein [candidate division Zixibacteria bacterium]
MNLSKKFIIFLIVLFAASPILAEFKYDVTEHKLANGLTVLLYENHNAPLISTYTFFKVGSRNERPGITGISHFFEHMMFNGAKRYGPKMFDLTLERNGGYSNAYTSRNMTAYYQNFSSDILELVIDMESDRMANLAFEPEMLASEIGVVKEERRVGIDNSNTGLLYEELYATAYKAHSYSWPVIGWMEDLNSITREDCLLYHKTYYAPNNAVMVITGDFETARAIKLLEDYYKDIPSGPPPPPVVKNEPEQRGPRRVIINNPASHSHIMLGYHVGDKDSPDLYAMEVLQSVLTAGESSRMQQALLNDLELITGMYGGFGWGYDPSLFNFYFAVSPSKTYQEVENAVDSVLADFIKNGPTKKEMEKAKNALTANFYRNYKTNNGIAHEIGYYHSLYGDWKTMYGFVDKIKAVTADEVKNAAAKYFTKNNSTLAVLIPEGGGQ